MGTTHIMTFKRPTATVPPSTHLHRRRCKASSRSDASLNLDDAAIILEYDRPRDLWKVIADNFEENVDYIYTADVPAVSKKKTTATCNEGDAKHRREAMRATSGVTQPATFLLA